MATLEFVEISLFLQNNEIEKASKIILENELSLSEIRWYLSNDYFEGDDLDQTLLEIADIIIFPYFKKIGDSTSIEELTKLLTNMEVLTLSSIIINEGISFTTMAKNITISAKVENNEIGYKTWSDKTFTISQLLAVADNILGEIYEKKAL